MLVVGCEADTCGVVTCGADTCGVAWLVVACAEACPVEIALTEFVLNGTTKDPSSAATPNLVNDLIIFFGRYLSFD